MFKIADVLAMKADSKPAKRWFGTPPTDCNLCHEPIENAFVDGKTAYGPWAMMCLSCHADHGGRTGTGFGQVYHRTVDGHWVKVMG